MMCRATFIMLHQNIPLGLFHGGSEIKFLIIYDNYAEHLSMLDYNSCVTFRLYIFYISLVSVRIRTTKTTLWIFTSFRYKTLAWLSIVLWEWVEQKQVSFKFFTNTVGENCLCFQSLCLTVCIRQSCSSVVVLLLKLLEWQLNMAFGGPSAKATNLLCVYRHLK